MIGNPIILLVSVEYSTSDIVTSCTKNRVNITTFWDLFLETQSPVGALFHVAELHP